MCLQVTIQVLETGCSSTLKYQPSYSSSYLHFIFCDRFVVHLKVIIFSAIATDDRHPLRRPSDFPFQDFPISVSHFSKFRFTAKITSFFTGFSEVFFALLL